MIGLTNFGKNSGFSGRSAIVHGNDQNLIRACQRGDQHAWNELIEQYGGLVYSIPRRFGLSEADADDVFATVWATAFRHLDSLRDQTRLSAWLITTTQRETWRVGKARRKLDAIVDDGIADGQGLGEDQVLAWERQHLVRQGLDRLGGNCKELLSALFLEPAQPCYEAIADRLGMPVGSIGPTRARCFKKLEKILAELGFDNGHGSREEVSTQASG